MRSEHGVHRRIPLSLEIYMLSDQLFGVTLNAVASQWELVILYLLHKFFSGRRGYRECIKQAFDPIIEN